MDLPDLGSSTGADHCQADIRPSGTVTLPAHSEYHMCILFADGREVRMGSGYAGLVEKRVFELPGAFKTIAGETIEKVRVGWESIGTLNEAGTNAILIAHYNSGSSHFAGRYAKSDPLPGYWDAIVGPEKPLDTDRYFLVSVDSLCNVGIHDGHVVSTGPASSDPATGKPYGMRFPRVQIRDFVNVQKALLDSLGVRRLHAVMGASMGSMQAFEWAVAYPEVVDRVIGVVPGAYITDYSLLFLSLMRTMVMQDPDWRGGDYYGSKPPLAGLSSALRLMNSISLCNEWGEAFFRRRLVDPPRDPTRGADTVFASVAFVEDSAAKSVKVADANHFLYVQRANELFALGGKPSLEEGLALVRCPVLLLPATTDQIFPLEETRKIRDILAAQGKAVDWFEIPGPLGHLGGAAGIGAAAPAIEAFLDR